MKMIKKWFNKKAEAETIEVPKEATKKPNYQRRLPEVHVEMIQVLIAKNFKVTDIARLFNMAQSSVSHIKSRNRKLIGELRQAFQ